MSGFGQKVGITLQTYTIFPYDPFEYRLSFYVVSFINFYNLECCIVKPKVLEIRVLRKIIWPQCEKVTTN